MPVTPIAMLTEGVAPRLRKMTAAPSLTAMRGLNTAIELIPAPGEDKVIIPMRAFITLPAGTAFAGGSAIAIDYENNTALTPLPNIAATFLTAATAGKSLLVPAGANAYALGDAVNSALQMSSTAAFTAGRDGFQITIYYYIMEL